MSAVLDSADDFELVGIAENGEKALSAVNELRPDVLIIELMLPVMDGMRRAQPPARAGRTASGGNGILGVCKPADRRGMRSARRDLFLRKPMEPQAVCERLRLWRTGQLRGQGRGKHGA